MYLVTLSDMPSNHGDAQIVQMCTFLNFSRTKFLQQKKIRFRFLQAFSV